jgi:hypothetical protein
VSDAPDWTAVYRASLYVFPDAGERRRWSLDGEHTPPARERSLTLITAWNPDSAERPWAENEAANARLLRDLVASGAEWSPAHGASLPGVEPSWREEGFAVRGWSRTEACRWGREWGQRAVVWCGDQVADLLFCAEERAVSCLIREHPPADRVLPGSPGA